MGDNGRNKRSICEHERETNYQLDGVSNVKVYK